ncbi:MAG: sugar phosphate isomerase/epimerase family protein [Bacteroidales bacterium]
MKNVSSLLVTVLLVCISVACNGKKPGSENDNSETPRIATNAPTEFKNVNPDNKFIGLQLWSVRDDMQKNTKLTIETLGKIGYKFVEMAGYSNGKFYGMEPEDFKKLCEDNGIKVLGSHYGPNISKEEGSLEKAIEEWKIAIDAHKRVGCEYIVKASQGAWAYQSLEGLKAYCDYYNKIGELCKDAGISFGYHNHDKEFNEVEGTVMYDYMLENTKPEKVFFELDLYWIKKGGKVATDYVSKYAGRFNYYHVKNEKELTASEESTIKEPIKMAEKAGLKGLIIEIEQYNFEPLVSAMNSLKFLSERGYVKTRY